MGGTIPPKIPIFQNISGLGCYMFGLYMRKYLLLLFIVVSALPAIAQQLALAGRVTDQSGKAVAFTSVYIRNSTYGTVANEQGTYQFKLTPGNYAIISRAPGYKEQMEKVTISDGDVHHD